MGRKYVYYSKKDIMIDSEISKEYIRIKKEMLKLEKELQPIEDRLKEELRETMKKVEVSNFISNGLEVKLTKDTIRNNFDTTRFKEDNIQLYNQYLKPTNVKGSLSINLERGI
jgi:hypothetical protein